MKRPENSLHVSQVNNYLLFVICHTCDAPSRFQVFLDTCIVYGICDEIKTWKIKLRERYEPGVLCAGDSGATLIIPGTRRLTTSWHQLLTVCRLWVLTVSSLICIKTVFAIFCGVVTSIFTFLLTAEIRSIRKREIKVELPFICGVNLRQLLPVQKRIELSEVVDFGK